MPHFLGGGAIPKKILCCALLVTDTRHALKLHKDPFRGIDGLGFKESNIRKTDAVAMWLRCCAMCAAAKKKKNIQDGPKTGLFF